MKKSDKLNVSRYATEGFTIMEVLVVLGIVTLILFFTVVSGFDSIRKSSLQSERALVVNILERARSQAVNNIHGLPHGVHFSPAEYTLFEGTTFVSGASTNQTFAVAPGSTHSGMSDVIFSSLSGDTTPGTLTITLGGASTQININSEGGINW